MRASPGLAMLLAAAVLAGCQKEEEPPAPPRPVLSMVVSTTAQSTLTLPGTIEPRIKTELGFRILGRIVARNVEVGDLVRRGDVVAAIDPLALELAVRSAQSDLANSQAQLGNAVLNEERQRRLVETQTGSQATLETAEQERRTAAAAVAKAQANLSKASEQLSYAELRAEFDGVVTATSAEVGQVVSAGQSVATIARPEQRDAVIDVPEDGAKSVRAGAQFEVALQLDPSIRTTGIVREIAPDADEATRTRRTRLTLADPPEALRLGAVITAAATVSAEPVIRVPVSAVLSEGAESVVWVVDVPGKKVVRRKVTLDGPLTESGVVTVSEGLTPGERIAVAGAHTLTDGQAVRIDQEINR